MGPRIVNCEYAPVLICTYTRLQHLQRTVRSLSNNSCAINTDLYIASDYPYDGAHALMVKKVREYIKTIDGFNSVNIILRDRNFGTNANYYDALDIIFKKHDRVVLMEDDIVTGRYFLKFINDGLRLYGPDSNVLAVCGYMWPKISRRVVGVDCLLLPLYNAWGTAFHRENFKKIKSNAEVSQRVLSDWRLFLKANLLMPGIALLLLEMAKGRLRAWDVDCFLYMLERNLLVLFPSNSLVKNIGFDGTGLHCGVDASFEEQKINEEQAISVRALTPDEFLLYKKLSFKAFGGWSAFLKGLFLFYLKKIVGEEMFAKIIPLKKYLK